MDIPFQFSRYVTGKFFVGRRQDCAALAEWMSSGENVAMWGAPKAGRMSVVQQALDNMKASGKDFIPCFVNLTGIYEVNTFIRLFAGKLISLAASDTAGMEKAAGRLIAGSSLTFDESSLTFDEDSYAKTGAMFGTTGVVTREDIDLVAELPFVLAAELGRPIVIIFREFQNIDSDEGEWFFKALERSISRHKGERGCSFVFTGSRHNAMESIFLRRRFFWKQVNRYRLHDFSEMELTEHVLRGFTAGGKVIERDLIQSICRLLHNNIWYINHFFFICDSLSKGYISELTLNDALANLISVNEPRFRATVYCLTGFQKRLLKAILDGNVRISSIEIIERYRLNSSANVKRLKEALMKKEVVMFNDKDEPEIQDPLFEYWLRERYYNTRENF